MLAAASELATVAQQDYNDANTADAARQQAAQALSGAAGELANAAGGSGSGDLTAALGQLQQGAAQLPNRPFRLHRRCGSDGGRQCGAGG